MPVSRTKKRLSASLGAVAILAVAATVASASTMHSSKQQLVHLNVGLALIPPKMTFVGFYVARDKGFFKKNGLDVKLEGFDGGVKSLRGVASGSVDMGATSADDVIAAATQGGGVHAVWSYAMPLDTTMVADQSVKTVKDLVGKNIGITDPGGFADVQARAVLAQAGIKPSQVHIISLPNRAALLPALVSGRINAAPFHADDGFAAREQDPKLHNIKALYDTLPYWWYGSLAVKDGYMKAHGDNIRKFITAMDQADRWMYSHRAATIAIGVKYTQESKATVSHAYDFLAKAMEWTVNTGLQPNLVMGTMQHEFQYKEIPRVPAYNEVADPTFAGEVVAQIGAWTKGY